MAIPTVKVLLLPTLQSLEDGQRVSHADLIDRVAERMQLSEGDRTEMNSSNTQRKIYERVTWTVVHMRNARLVQAVARGVTQITERGLELLSENPPELSYKMLKERYPEYDAFDKKGYERRKKRLAQLSAQFEARGNASGVAASSTKPTTSVESTVSAASAISTAPSVRRTRLRPVSPHLEQTLEKNIKALRDGLEAAVARRVGSLEVDQLSRIVLALLAKMGYGDADSHSESAGSLTSGVTIRDPLGLNQVYARVATGEKADVRDLQEFAGAFDAAHAERGIFVSIGGFTSEARGYALGSAKRIKIMDASELSRLLVTHEVGIIVHARHTVKRIDPSYFERLRQTET